jgi:hypothetical protein
VPLFDDPAATFEANVPSPVASLKPTVAERRWRAEIPLEMTLPEVLEDERVRARW